MVVPIPWLQKQIFRAIPTAIIVMTTFFQLALIGCASDDNTTMAPAEPNVLIDGWPKFAPTKPLLLYYHAGVVRLPTGELGVDPDSVGLWLADSSGTNARMIMNGQFMYADWSPDSEWIVYAHQGSINKIRVSGGYADSATITQLSAGGSFFPAWSPTGDWIAYDAPDADGVQSIWLMKPDGTQKQVFDRKGMGEWRRPNWDPSGTKLFHTRFPTGTYYSEVYVMENSGANPVRLTNNNAEDDAPGSSPDGSLVAFHAISNNDFSVWLMAADGTGARKLVSGRDPAWLPDGSEIAFSRFDTENPGDNGTIWAIRPDGTGLRRLTTGP